MSRILRSFVLVLLVLFVSLPVMAETAASIAVVDVQKLLTESKAGKNIQSQLEERKTKFLSEISAEEKKLREDEKDLSEQRASLPAEEFSKKAKEFESKLGDTRRKAQERKKALEESAAKALTTLRDEIIKIVQQISDEKSYSLVVSRQSVVINNKSLDVTDAAMEKLNASLAAVPLDSGGKK